MPLSKIDRFAVVDTSRQPAEVFAEVCRVLNDTVRKLAEVNNECIQLRQELEAFKQRSK
jgi:hypothetical protein